VDVEVVEGWAHSVPEQVIVWVLPEVDYPLSRRILLFVRVAVCCVMRGPWGKSSLGLSCSWVFPAWLFVQCVCIGVSHLLHRSAVGAGLTGLEDRKIEEILNVQHNLRRRGVVNREDLVIGVAEGGCDSCKSCPRFHCPLFNSQLTNAADVVPEREA
jgi:hypothetical protein